MENKSCDNCANYRDCFTQFMYNGGLLGTECEKWTEEETGRGRFERENYYRPSTDMGKVCLSCCASFSVREVIHDILHCSEIPVSDDAVENNFVCELWRRKFTMREIEFRGKRKGKYAVKKWLYGGFYTVKGIFYVRPTHVDFGMSVYPDTVGQYTGLVDINGVKIFEGDIVRSTSCMDEVSVGEIYFVVVGCLATMAMNPMSFITTTMWKMGPYLK